MCTKMLGNFIILVSSVLFLNVGAQDLSCSSSWGSSCPVVPLVSGPVCPNGFDQVEKYCFKVSVEPAYWNESKAKCEELNAKLAEPRELLFNSTAFVSYLWQYIDDSYTDDYYDFYEGIFNLGGQFTNNSWQWVTGGNISNNFQIYGKECLAIHVYDYGDLQFTRSEKLENIEFYLYDTPCNSSFVWQAEGDFSYGNFRYVCQAVLQNNSYSTCNHNGMEYASGQLVSMNKQQCQQTWCQDGTIQQYTCGNITTGCCKYKGKLYGKGDIIGPEIPTEDCNGCQHQVCQAGVIQWQTCRNCSTKCCLFNNESYQPGSHIQGTCARLVCEGATGQFNLQGIDYSCPKCKAYLDPHIVTYDSKWSYSYQGCGNYSLTQISNTYQPTSVVYATFSPCGDMSTLTCVDTVTFKNDESTVITIGYNNSEYKIEVNGEDYKLPSFSPRIVQVMNTTYPVISWISGNCVSLQGSNGILVRFCGSNWSNQVYVWADPDVASTLQGLCGTVSDDVNDDFTTRNGTITSPWDSNPPLEFPLSWLSSATGNESCNNGKSRIKRQTQNECDTNSSVRDNYQNQCKSVVEVSLSNAEPEEVKTMIDDCVFDLCNVSNPNEWLSAVRQTVQIQRDIQENTLNFTTTVITTTSLPTTTEIEPDTTPIELYTTIEPYTTTPNTTIDCNCKRKCWKKSGFCTNDPESCDGRVKNKGCDGPGCVCCISEECRPKNKCYRKGGFCISSSETCDGNTTSGCWGQDCVCCLKTERCQPKKNCWSKGGACVAKISHCKGKIIENGCKSENCYCCVNQPRC